MILKTNLASVKKPHQSGENIVLSLSNDNFFLLFFNHFTLKCCS